MKIPFTIEQFWGVFIAYNTNVFPIQLIWLSLGLSALLILFTTWRDKSIYAGCALGLLWLWIGIVYHILFFTAICAPAFVFGALFVVEGLLIFFFTFRRQLCFSSDFRITKLMGCFFMLYGLLIYPIIGYLLEGALTRVIVIGLPCPSTIFSFGLLMLADREMPGFLLIIPALWALVGVSAALNLAIYQDLMILVAAVCAILAYWHKKALMPNSKNARDISYTKQDVL